MEKLVLVNVNALFDVWDCLATGTCLADESWDLLREALEREPIQQPRKPQGVKYAPESSFFRIEKIGFKSKT